MKQEGVQLGSSGEALPKGMAVPEGLLPSKNPQWDLLRSIGGRIGDADWYSDLFGGRSKEKMKQQKISPDLVANLVGKLEHGRYIGPLETQPINWSDTKIYRDFVQNFFDGMKNVGGRPTLDGVDFLRKKVKEGDKTLEEFSIVSPAEYDHRYLIHHGGTTKFGDEQVVGEFGEGVKIASFLLLKNGVTEQIELGSDHWVARYYLDELPPEDYPEKVRGLFLRAEFVKEGTRGNFLRFRTDENTALRIGAKVAEMKDFFWHKDHPDFQNPTYENGSGGFKILPKGSGGNLYVTGQRHEYEKPEAWSEAVPGLHIWTFRKVMEKTRDRNYARSYEVSDEIINPLVKSMKKDDLLKVLFEGEEYWLDAHTYNGAERIISDVAYRLAKELTEQEKRELRERMPDDVFVEGGENDREYEKLLEKIGFRRCMSAFSGLGVLGAKEIIMSLVETAKEPKLEGWENQRLEILDRAVQSFINTSQSKIIDKYLKFLRSPVDKPEGEDDPDAWERLSVRDVLENLRYGNVPKLIIQETATLELKGGRGRIEIGGFTGGLFPDKIFLQRRLLKGDFLEALLTWAHEFAHNISGGDDYTAKFTDTERYLHELLLITAFNSDELKHLRDEWDNIKLAAV